VIERVDIAVMGERRDGIEQARMRQQSGRIERLGAGRPRGRHAVPPGTFTLDHHPSPTHGFIRTKARHGGSRNGAPE
jgi:hypothetical protein